MSFVFSKSILLWRLSLELNRCLALRVITKTFLVNHCLKFFFRKFKVIPRPVKQMFWFRLRFLSKTIKVRVFWIKYSIPRHCSAVILLSGLNCNIWFSRSASSGLILGNNFSHFCRDRFGSDLMYLIASSFPKLIEFYQYISYHQMMVFLEQKLFSEPGPKNLSLGKEEFYPVTKLVCSQSTIYQWLLSIHWHSEWLLELCTT